MDLLILITHGNDDDDDKDEMLMKLMVFGCLCDCSMSFFNWLGWDGSTCGGYC